MYNNVSTKRWVIMKKRSLLAFVASIFALTSCSFLNFIKKGNNTNNIAHTTVLIYMCGSNLESDYANDTDLDDNGSQDWYGWGLATMDILEILSVPNKPNDINIVIETGGATKWTNNSYGNYSDDYSINASKLQIHHVNSNGKIELDDTLPTYKSMGESDTLQSFIEYGLNTYPAEKTALILWNHGGGLHGVCFDEKRSSDSLTADEVADAVDSALSNTGHEGEKLEWIGYDACLMAVQDIAEINSHYFKYMIASQETESGLGWDYDKWVDDLYAKKSTPEVLEAICDSFVAENDYDEYGHYMPSQNDQTLAYFDLSKASLYRNAWEDMAAHISLTSGNKSQFKTLMGSCKYFGGDDYTAYGLFDAKHFVTKLAAGSYSFKPASTYTDAVLSAFAEFVPHAAIGGGAGNSNGLSLFWFYNSTTKNYNSALYTIETTNFTNWCNLTNTYGGSVY